MSRLSVIVPVFNEAATAEVLLRRVAAVDFAPDERDIVVVDDASTDGTSARLARLGGELGFKLLRHGRNRGKGAAIRTGLAAATGDWAVVQDADLEYEPADLKRLAAAARAGAPVVYGSRWPTGSTAGARTLFARGSRVLTRLFNWLYGTRLTDLNTCYKLFRIADLRRFGLTTDGFEFCEEVTAKAVRAGLPIAEVPVSYRPRSGAEGKKIKLRDGLVAVATMLRFRFWRP